MFKITRNIIIFAFLNVFICIQIVFFLKFFNYSLKGVLLTYNRDASTLNQSNNSCNLIQVEFNNSKAIKYLNENFKRLNQQFVECENISHRPEVLIEYGQSVDRYTFKIINLNNQSSTKCLARHFFKEARNTSESQSILDEKESLPFNEHLLLVVNKTGFYHIHCNANITIFDSIITVLPKNMSLLIEANQKNKNIVNKIKSKLNDSTLNPFLSDGNLYNKCNQQNNSQDSKMNVLFIAFDSVSRNHFRRVFPNSLNYLQNTMKNNFIFDNLMVVGKNTYPNLMSLLTSVNLNMATEAAMVDKMKLDNFNDYVPFIWNEFEKQGYLTMYNEDYIDIGTFNYGQNGFKHFPVSYYNSPFWFKYQSLLNNSAPFCLGKTPTYEVGLEQIDTFVRRMNESPNQATPYFSFNFFNYYTHDNFAVPPNLDLSLKKTLERLENDKLLDNTMLFVMSDHGNRLSYYYSYTDEGKVEHAEPFLSVKLPSRFENTIFKKNFLNNRNRLLTSFDLHKTLKQFLYFNTNGLKSMQTQKKCRELFATSNKEIRALRGVSLFEEIAAHRSCSDALVPDIHCNCNRKEEINEMEFTRQTNTTIKQISNYLIQNLNEITDKVRDKCIAFKMEMILSIKKLNFQELKQIYEMEFIAQPGEARFQANIEKKSNKFILTSGFIRISKYGNQSICMKEKNLMEYCFCKSKTATSKIS